MPEIGALKGDAGAAGAAGATGATGAAGAAGAAGASGVAQVVSLLTGAVASGSTIIPSDDSIPQNTEGDEYMTLAITPVNANNKLIVDVIVYGSINGLNHVNVALFRDSGVDAVLAMSTIIPGSFHRNTSTLRYIVVAGSTAATTFKVRCGPESSATFTFNGANAARHFGGVAASSIIIREVVV